MKLLKSIGVFLGIFSACYLLCAFASGVFNPMDWAETPRVLFTIIVSAFAAIFAVVAYE